MSRWIDIPRTFFAGGASKPYLVTEEHVPALREFVTSSGAGWASIDLSIATDVAAAINCLKDVLKFPDWCASSWDSIEDAFEEIRQGWHFPLVVAIGGLRPLLNTDPQVGLDVVVHLSQLSEAFSIAGDQFTLVYIADRWIGESV